MDQLSLFAGIASGVDAPAGTLGSADEAPFEPDSVAAVDGATSQVGLFDARVRRVRAVREAIAAGEIDFAHGALQSMKPGADFDVNGARERLPNISKHLADAGRLPPRESAAAMAALGRAMTLEDEPWSRLGRTLLARAAASVEKEAGVLAARLFVEAGDFERARSALNSALQCARSAELLFALGDVQTLRGNHSAARCHYRDALLTDPFHPAFETVLDDEVRLLAHLAEWDVEIENHPRAWAAAVGVIVGVFPPPAAGDARSTEPGQHSAVERQVLARARRFVEALSLLTTAHPRHHSDGIVEARRTMKQASPALFAWYMARLGRNAASRETTQRPGSSPSGSRPHDV